MNLDRPDTVASLIDHTLLKPDATRADIIRVCAEAHQFSFASVCINPFWVRLAKQQLAGSSVRVCTVIGFPLGANKTETKLMEARTALEEGATELDVVQNIGALRSGEARVVGEELKKLADLTHANGAILKVILETSLLSAEEKRVACRLAVEAGLDFVKTSTGFAGGGATAEDVSVMRSIVGHGIGVKASGGIRTLPALREMVNAGASRIGTSSGISILRELESGSNVGSSGKDSGSY
ncbi:MAG: deoxyribose-phosphate aldolase [Bryobacteraceae bacterium]